MRVDFADVAVDTQTREITRGGQAVHLSPKAFELLLLLIESRPQAVAKRALHDRLWPDTFVVEKNLTNLVAEIRKAIGDTPVAPRFLRTVQRFGYALRDDPPDARDVRTSGTGGCIVRVTWPEGRARLLEGEHVVGRARDAAICLQDDSVSRRHAVITVTGSGAMIADLDSKNGTALGSRRIFRRHPPRRWRCRPDRRHRPRRAADRQWRVDPNPHRLAARIVIAAGVMRPAPQRPPPRRPDATAFDRPTTSLAPAPCAPPDTSPPARPVAWTEGDLVGPYQVVRLLGRGGMGEVFEAIDVRSQTAVAIKVARRPLAAAADRVRFLDEGRIDLFIEELPDRPGADVRSARHQ